MPTLTLIQGDDGVSTSSQFTADCPNWLFVAVNDQELSLESWCGRYFEQLDNLNEDIREMVCDADCGGVPDGLYVIEGHAGDQLDPDAENRETEWIFDRLRPISPEEWARYCAGEPVWDPAHYDPDFVVPNVIETASEIHELVEASRGWLDWRKQLEIPLCSVEVRLISALQALEDRTPDTP